ncbi:serine hydrolase [Janibacter sp. Soil728]|uniref:serine hydrolase domain-containing protein n=1 Tax=Janibacter sp. Soil728 TaxID=1736393 RepID=UPI000702030A|nr:serine hydrolase domain-containing protein [Janibacter sp. Soil728]KRE35724.1 serine hydrolase [Janibacter sp. Soil728]
MTGASLLPTTTRRLDRSTAIRQARGRVPSLVTGVVRDGELVHSCARGSFAPDVDPLQVQYRIGSITKTFVAVAVMRLRDAGRLGLDTPIGDHVPGTPFASVTIAQLLTHTGGVSAELPGAWWERSPGPDRVGLHEAMRSGTVLARAGRHVHYSNLGFAVLGDLVERLTDRPWHEVVTDEILAPLGMSRTTALPVAPSATGYAVHPHADVLLPEAVQDARAMGPAGQLWSTVPDLGRWAAFVAGDTGEVLSPDSLEEMCEPVAATEGNDGSRTRGLGFEIVRERGRLVTGHGGSMPGFQASLRVDRATRTGVVMVLNATTAGEAQDAEDPFDVLDECEPRLPDAWFAQDAVPRDLLALTGSWFWGTSEGVLRLLPDGWLQLDSVSGMMPPSRFRPTGEDTWVGLHRYFRGETLRVVRDAHGAATHLDIGTFVLTRRPYEPGDVIPGGMHEGGWPTT